ncbi:MAG: hypothetical protein A3F70_03695 [Acidobacteria bacterium RIFCSPLOWO2_12_FULL_67_14]|nr:MAG: hypothetical protein A3H29_15925 [Acidobacteria bacterium RIFCSPLOWO2_02_FULL_67_21]OFW40100.1 MAG: hypothetical protein A3F70_03695 [Acidobacteria bacterium RIFCSPLOWO2_12_FULL_67_14]
MNPGAAVVALLGRRLNLPAGTDAIESYSTLLGEALTRQGWRTTLVQVPWDEIGWARALHQLWRQSHHWSGHWVVVQYTALHWSWRGLPLAFLALLSVLRHRGARVAIVFHDPTGYPGERLRHRVRRAWQHHVMRLAYRISHLSVHTIPVERVPWLPGNPHKAVLIPVGPNVPAFEDMPHDASTVERRSGDRTIAVFCLRAGERTEAEEVSDIAYVAQRVAERVPQLRIVVLGRSAENTSALLQAALAPAHVDLAVTGVLPAEELSRRLIAADALLFVRGAISGGRTTAIAAIACGLPVVAYAGPQTGHPITEAGVVVVAPGDRDGLATELIRLLTDDSRWSAAHQRNLAAFHRYFSWDAIAARFAAAFAAA